MFMVKVRKASDDEKIILHNIVMVNSWYYEFA